MIGDEMWIARRRDDKKNIVERPGEVISYTLTEEEKAEAIRKFGPPNKKLPERTKSIAWGANGRVNKA
jgi:hypothetical protein